MSDIAPRDKNFIPTLLAILNTDGTTVKSVQANSSANTLKVSNGSSGSDNGPKNALRDQNNVPTICGVSSADGKTIVPLYANSSGQLLISS